MVVSLFMFVISKSLFRFGWKDLELPLCDLGFVGSFVLLAMTRFRVFIMQFWTFVDLWCALMDVMIRGGLRSGIFTEEYWFDGLCWCDTMNKYGG